jgi:hypothetical protein
MSPYVRSFFRAWIVTVVVETVALIVIFRKLFRKEPVDLKLLISSGIFASSLTLPYVWFVFPYIFLGKYSLSLGLSELFAWLVEAVFYKIFLKISLKNAIIASFIANLLSYSAGYFFGRYFI